MSAKNNLKKKFVNSFCQITKLCKETGQEIEINHEKGRKDAFDDVLQWYNKVSDNGEKLVSTNQIILYLQEKIENAKNQLNQNSINGQNQTDVEHMFSFPDFD